MKGFLVLGSILATLLAALFWAAPADAYVNQVSASTLVEWQGSPCVQATGPSVGNPYVLGTPSYTCQPGPSGAPRWARWDELRVSGQYVGVDPIMGDNNWIKCTLFINGAVEVSDYATRGDGTNVTCLRTVN